MLYYDRIDVSEKIDVNKAKSFEDKGFMFQGYIFNGCHDI